MRPRSRSRARSGRRSSGRARTPRRLVRAPGAAARGSPIGGDHERRGVDPALQDQGVADAPHRAGRDHPLVHDLHRLGATGPQRVDHAPGRPAGARRGRPGWCPRAAPGRPSAGASASVTVSAGPAHRRGPGRQLEPAERCCSAPIRRSSAAGPVGRLGDVVAQPLDPARPARRRRCCSARISSPRSLRVPREVAAAGGARAGREEQAGGTEGHRRGQPPDARAQVLLQVRAGASAVCGPLRGRWPTTLTDERHASEVPVRLPSVPTTDASSHEETSVPKSRIRRRSAFTPPQSDQPKAVRVGSPRWLVPAMVACFVVGLLWMVVYYVTQTEYPIEAHRLLEHGHRLRPDHRRLRAVHPLEVTATAPDLRKHTRVSRPHPLSPVWTTRLSRATARSGGARGWWRWPSRRPRTWSAGRSGCRVAHVVHQRGHEPARRSRRAGGRARSRRRGG